MADLLTQALINAQRDQVSPWQTAGQNVTKLSAQVLQDPAYANDDPNSRLIASLISGIGGAALQGFGAYEARQQKDALNNDLRNISKAYYGGESLDPFYENTQSRSARDLLPVLEVERAAGQRAAQQERALKRQGLEDALLFNKGISVQPDETGALDFRQNPSFSRIGAQEKYQDALATNQAKVDVEGRMGASPKEIVDREDKFRSELFQRSGIDDLRTIDQSFNSMLKSYSDTSGASDLDFVFGVAKTLDPSSVVREGEQVTMQRTDGIFGDINRYLGQLKGGRRLEENTRKGLLQLAANRRDQLVDTYSNAVNEYKGLTERAGGNFANVGIYGDFKPSESLLEALSKPAQASPTPSSIPPGMKLQRNPRTGATRLVPQ